VVPPTLDEQVHREDDADGDERPPRNAEDEPGAETGPPATTGPVEADDGDDREESGEDEGQTKERRRVRNAEHVPRSRPGGNESDGRRDDRTASAGLAGRRTEHGETVG
jgi:hypothetical protein